MNSISLAAVGNAGSLFPYKSRSRSNSRVSIYASNASMAAAVITTTNPNEHDKEDHHHSIPKSCDPVVLRTVTVDESFRRMEELVGSEEEEKNWKGIVIALLVIGFILALIVVAIVLVTPGKIPYDPGNPFTFSHLTNPDLRMRDPIYSWVKGLDEYVTLIEKSDDNRFITVIKPYQNLTTIDELVPYSVIAGSLPGIDGVEVSRDLKHVLIRRQTQDDGVTVSSQYQVYSSSDSMVKWLAAEDDVINYATYLGESDKLVFVKENNIYVKQSFFTDPTQITSDGSETVLNGLPDREYRAYILPEHKALIWPEGKTSKFAFAKVKTHSSVTYATGGVQSSILTSERHETSTVTLHVYDGSSTTDLPLPDADGFLTSVRWADDDTLLVSWLKKSQKEVLYLICSVGSARCDSVFSYVGKLDENTRLNFVGLYGDWLLDRQRKDMYMILPDPASPNKYHRHIAAVKLEASERQNPVTRFFTRYGWSDLKLLGLDGNTIYYMSTGANYTHRHLYSLNVETSNYRCLTCHLNSTVNTTIPLTYFDAVLSDSKEFVQLSTLGPDLPAHYVMSIRELVHRNQTLSSSLVHQLDGHRYSKIKSALQYVHLPLTKYVQIPLTKNNFQASVKLTLPSVWRGFQNYMYSLIIIMADKPDEQIADSQHSLGFYEYLSKEHRYIIAEVDLRGSGNRGELVRQALYGNIGVAEATDLHEIAKFVNETTDEYKINSSRVALIGRAYGGYSALHALGKAESAIRCGVIISPVTQLNNHDGWLADRYMGNNSNELNYKCNEDTPVCSIPHSNSFLLIQGTEDKMVDASNSYRLMKDLQKAGYEFKQQLYPGEGHNLEFSEIQSHYYKTITNYLQECLDGAHQSVV